MTRREKVRKRADLSHGTPSWGGGIVLPKVVASARERENDVLKGCV